jgi:putative transposase
MQSQGGLSIVGMCDLATVSRASFYRHWEKEAPAEAEVALRDATQRIAAAHRFYGYRRVTVVVQREGYEVGAQKVRRLMKEDNLPAVRRRKFVAATDSTHGFVVYPNLAEPLIVNDMNQLWVADITCVRLLAELVYLAVVLDAFSRRAVGWALARNLQTRLPLAALEHALASRQPADPKPPLDPRKQTQRSPTCRHRSARSATR